MKQAMKIDKSIDGNLALNLRQDIGEYSTPEIQIYELKAIREQIVRGCWQQSYADNGGDGC